MEGSLQKFKLFLIIFFVCGQNLYSSEICYTSISPIDKKNSEIEILWKEIWENQLKKGNHKYLIIDSDNSISNKLQRAKIDKCEYYLELQYNSEKNKPTIYYSQIYNAETGEMIDGYSYSSDLNTILESLNIDGLESEESNSESIEKFSKRVINLIRSNPRKNTRYQNLLDHVSNSPISSLKKIEIPEQSIRKESEEIFSLLSETESISIVSKRVDREETSSKTSAIVSVVNETKIKQSGARNLVDILKSLPGVEIYYNQLGFYEISIRGVQNKSGVLLLLDGHRINNFYDGSSFLDIRADLIQKVEVIRGPGSSVHGTNAFVGVINVITKKTEKNQSINSSVRLGSENTFEPSVIFGKHITDELEVHGYASKYESMRPEIFIENDITCTPSNWKNLGCNTTLVPLPWNRSIRTNDRKNQVNASLGFNYKDNYYINTKIIQESRGPNVGELAEITPDSENYFRFLIGDIGIKNQEIFSWLSFSMKMYSDRYNRQDNNQIQRSDRLSHLGISPREKISYNFETKGIESILQIDITKNFLFLLGGQYEELFVSDYIIQKNYPRTEVSNIFPVFYDFDQLNKTQNDKRFIKAGYGQFLYDPFKWMSIVAGVRYDEYSDFGKTINPKGGLVLIPMETKDYGSISIKFLYGEAFRAPTFQELYNQTQAFKAGGVFGNQELKPETIKTFEVGIEYNTPYRPLSVLVNGYYNDISNNIAALNNSGTFPSTRDRYSNFRGIKVIGGELETRLNFDSRNYFYFNGSWFQAQDFGGFPPNEDVDTKTFLLDIPQARINLGANFEITKYLTMNHTVWISSERFSNARFSFEKQEDRSFRLPQYHIWNISVVTTDDLWSNAFLQFTVFNLQNFNAMEPSRIALPGFNNRSYPATWIYGRYMEFKFTYNL